MPLHSDDLPPDHEKHIWIIQTALYLVARGTILDPNSLGAESYYADSLKTMAVGKPYICQCGWVGINPKGYTWGEDRFGTDRYCPNCDDPPEGGPA